MRIAILVCLCLTSTLRAITPDEAVEVNGNLRILELLPNLICPLAVEPAVPADFVAMSPRGEPDAYDWIYWGPQDVLKSYFKNPDSLKQAILRVKLSANVVQTGPKAFDQDMEAFLEEMHKQNPKGFTHLQQQWGEYPILAIKDERENAACFMAWVGLNDPEAGYTLMFNLVPPANGMLSKNDKNLWEQLLMGTEGLKDGDFFRACGLDLQPGYTIVQVGKAKLKMTAEKRKRDGALQVVIVSITPRTEYLYEDMEEGLMGAEWNFKKPLVKVYGTIKDDQGMFGYAVSIFFDEVAEFSVNKEEIPSNTNYHIYQRLPESVRP